MPPENVHFKRLIHRIHTGRDLGEFSRTIYGGTPAKPAAIEFADIGFPRRLEKLPQMPRARRQRTAAAGRVAADSDPSGGRQHQSTPTDHQRVYRLP